MFSWREIDQSQPLTFLYFFFEINSGCTTSFGRKNTKSFLNNTFFGGKYTKNEFYQKYLITFAGKNKTTLVYEEDFFCDCSRHDDYSWRSGADSFQRAGSDG
jgi:hypothetical protein